MIVTLPRLEQIISFMRIMTALMFVFEQYDAGFRRYPELRHRVVLGDKHNDRETERYANDNQVVPPHPRRPRYLAAAVGVAGFRPGSGRLPTGRSGYVVLR